MKAKFMLAVSVIVTAGLITGCGIFDNEEETTTVVADEIKKTGTSDENLTDSTSEETTTAGGEEENTTGEAEETTTLSQSEENSHEKATYEGDLYSLSNDKITWGVGTQINDDNRPVSPVNLQNTYGSKYAVDWLKEDEKVIYLTFDEGYENGYTSQILDTLKEKNVKAVFFITMPYAKSEQELVRRMIDEGHVVGSHSVTHPSGGMMSLSVEEQINEYKELHQYVLDTYGYEMWLFRPPTGAFSEQTLAVSNYCGYRSVMWSFAYADWDPANQMEVGKALNNAVTKLHNGAVYLLHAVSKTNTEMLGDFIDQTREKGFEFKKYD